MSDKCTCVYATSANTKSVRDGYEMGGYVKEFCAYCIAQDEAAKPVDDKQVGHAPDCDLLKPSVIGKGIERMIIPRACDCQLISAQIYKHERQL